MSRGLGKVQIRCLEVLGRLGADPADSVEVAALVFGRTPITDADHASARRSLRKLAAAGLVVELGRSPGDGRKRWALRDAPPTPQRIRFNRFEGKPLPPHSRLVMRPGPFGNPFPVKGRGIEEAVRLYGEWLHAPEQAALRDRARRELRGLNLACSCPVGGPCHADALLELANGRGPASAGDKGLRLTTLQAEVLAVWALPAIPPGSELTTAEVGTILGYCPEWSRKNLHHRLVAMAGRGLLEMSVGTPGSTWKPGPRSAAIRGVIRGGGAA